MRKSLFILLAVIMTLTAAAATPRKGAKRPKASTTTTASAPTKGRMVSDDEVLESYYDGYPRRIIRTSSGWGVQNTENGRLIVPDKYKWIGQVGGHNGYCAKDENNYAHLFDKRGSKLGTFESIWNLGDDIVKVIKNGKLGIFNAKTMRQIIPCQYDDDIAWGGGSGQNRRFALSQKTSRGETLTVFTVGGRRIASKFFPRSASRYAIGSWGDKYLY